MLILILFIDDDDSTYIEDIHLSNVESKVIIRDNVDMDVD